MKLLFDENLGRPAILALADLVAKTRAGAEVEHLLDHVENGTADSDWIPKFAEGRWLLVTADRAKRCGGDRLPRLCAEAGLRHVLITGKLHQKKQFEKMRAILAVWPALAAAFDSVAGSRFSLQSSGDSFSLRAKQVPTAE